MQSGARFVFGPLELDTARRRLCLGQEPVALSDRQLDILTALVVHAGQIVPKDDLLRAGWKDVAVGDNSLEQAISSLRRVLAAHAPGVDHIETVPRRGYRFVAAVARHAPRESDAALDALLEPHRAFVEGRAALETLDRRAIGHARDVFEAAVASVPELASAHIGLANACALQFETTRADPAPDRPALELAVHHAREACRLDPQSGEAWATLGFVLDRSGASLDALAASKRATTLEPDNWRHHLRLAYVGWGEERLRAARRVLALLPDFPLARWLAATVYVARQALPEAERELAAGVAGDEEGAPAGRPFTAVALHWLNGLIALARGDQRQAHDRLHRELQLEGTGHLYARECCANVRYALGVLHLRHGEPAAAAAEFERAMALIPNHPLARSALAATRRDVPAASSTVATIDQAMVHAVWLSLAGRHGEAARLVSQALASAPPGSAGWLVPVEPGLNVAAHAEVWAPTLHLVRARAM